MEELLRRLGRRIRDLRNQRGWSQEKFSEICDVHRTWMGQIERGRNISVKTLANIADALNVTLSELFAGLAEGPDELDTPAPRGATIEPTPRVRAGQKTINVLLVELRAERAALQETVATLREVALGTMEKRKTPVRKRSPSPRRNRR